MTFVDQPQYVITLDADYEAGQELLVSFWAGPHQPPDVAPRIGPSSWGPGMRVRKIA